MRIALQRIDAGRAAVLATILGLAAILALPAAAGDAVPPPPAGKAAQTALALLNYNRELCDGIAGRLVAHWGKLGSSPQAQLETLRQRVVNRELSSLASARAAADLVEGFLPRIKDEAEGETFAFLERIHRLEIELCDTVAFPDGSREEFETELAKILDRIEGEEAELGRLLVVPEDQLGSARAPYLGHLLKAGVEAEGEYLDHLESLKPPPELPTLQDLMNAWHQQYAPAVVPTKQALGKYLAGRRANDPKLIRTACREISAAVIPLLRNHRVFEAPAPKVGPALRRAFWELKSMASQCSAGRSRETETHYLEMQTELSQAAGLLAEFSLKP